MLEGKTEKCYSCGSKRVYTLWPKKEDNSYQYINELPFSVSDNCEQVKEELPIVDCTNSVCAKIVLQNYDKYNEITEESGRKNLIIRDCWSRILNVSGSHFEQGPYIEKKVHLLENLETKDTVGYIYTCTGYLCNSSNIIKFASLFIFCRLLIAYFQIFQY
uniref:Protein quiver n=1 Tax=Strongyloides papillosus TaxID=174720 RepID=A0A0N5BLI1_STREA